MQNYNTKTLEEINSEETIENEVNVKPTLFKRLKSIATSFFKFLLIVMILITLSFGFSFLSTIHGKDIPADYFLNGYPSILVLMNSEFFMGLIFVITLSVIFYVLYLVWQLHEVAVHKAEKVASQHVQVVFALSLCGLFIDKMWWVLAVIIAFTRWDLISDKLSSIIHNGVRGNRHKESDIKSKELNKQEDLS